MTLLFLAMLVVTPSTADPARSGARSKPVLTTPQPAKTAPIPAAAEIVYHHDGQIFVMDRNGGNVVRITFDTPEYGFEHVAVSHDRRDIVANEQQPDPQGKPGGLSRLWLYDLEKGTKARLLPEFDSAGNGGVDWDAKGFIWFAAKEKDLVAEPKNPADFRANAGANDIYKIRVDGTGLFRVVKTPDRGEADVAVSADGTLITYVSQPLAGGNITEIWVAGADGSNQRRVYKAGQIRIASAHDPELSPDNTHVVFSIVNATVPPNFPKNPAANTAHDIYVIRIDGAGLKRLTRPGHISIIPGWRDDAIIFLDISERERYAGISLINPREPDQKPKLIKDGANTPKWIPAKSNVK